MKKNIKAKLPAYRTVGYIVGYDGQILGEEAPKKGSYILPREGLESVATIHETEEAALAELGDQTFVSTFSLSGTKKLVLRIHKIKVVWFPFAMGHLGYRRVAESV